MNTGFANRKTVTFNNLLQSRNRTTLDPTEFTAKKQFNVLSDCVQTNNLASQHAHIHAQPVPSWTLALLMSHYYKFQFQYSRFFPLKMKEFLPKMKEILTKRKKNPLLFIWFYVKLPVMCYSWKDILKTWSLRCLSMNCARRQVIWLRKHTMNGRGFFPLGQNFFYLGSWRKLFHLEEKKCQYWNL